MAARLIDAQGREFSIPSDKAVVVGRLPSCAIAIPESSVSREHAKIYLRDGAYFLVDLNSANGTFVNGKRITRAELAGGDEVTVGSSRLVFRTDADVPAPAAAATDPARPAPASGSAPVTAPDSPGFTLEDDPFAGDLDVARAEAEVVTIRTSQPARGGTSQPVIKTRDEILQFHVQPRSGRGGMLREDLRQRPLSFQLMVILIGLGLAALLFFGVKSVVGKLMPSAEESDSSSDSNR
jgi:predicted component of type VI protein secretion system